MAHETQFYVPGPSQIWLGLGPSVGWIFLGFTEAGLTVSLPPQYEDVEVDYAGKSPGAIGIMGVSGQCSGVLSRYDESVITQAATYFGANGIAGGIPNGGIGSLVYEEGISYPLLVNCPYGAKGVYGSMVPGFWFYNTFLGEGYEALLSIRPKKPRVSWRCEPVWGHWSGNTFTAGQPPFDGAAIYTNVLPNPLPSYD
jgi:hypothetical protein